MGTLLQLIGYGLSIGSLVCYILVLIKMFQNSETTMGVICIVTFILCGLGVLIAFIVGWINAGKWQIQQTMWIWTGCFIGGILINILTFAVLGAQIQGQGLAPM
ncbi:MAG: hypothetical protein JXM70_00815 [Pirellulales bacterium]|nr:hypothetical protein [Pirellulales bacterium]